MLNLLSKTTCLVVIEMTTALPVIARYPHGIWHLLQLVRRIAETIAQVASEGIEEQALQSTGPSGTGSPPPQNVTIP